MASSVKHTAGPWTFSARHPLNACAEVYADDGCTSIATCCGGDDAERDEQTGVWGPQPTRNANARLIAAAPDMLDALKGAEEWLSGWASAEPFLTTIRTAIAKAEGGAA